LGAAYAAGLAVEFWKDLKALKKNWAIHSIFQPSQHDAWREKYYSGWKKAVQKTLDWTIEDA